MNASTVDPCAELCAHDGSAICTGGFWNKNGFCHRYVFRGNPEILDYCYDTAESAATCPSNGTPAQVSDVARILASASAEKTTTSTTETEEYEDLEGLFGRIGRIRRLERIRRCLGHCPARHWSSWLLDLSTVVLPVKSQASFQPDFLITYSRSR